MKNIIRNCKKNNNGNTLIFDATMKHLDTLPIGADLDIVINYNNFTYYQKCQIEAKLIERNIRYINSGYICRCL